ncbi:MAG: hypothetical protein JF586_08770 [Burkholderiales bacterium]|nr:hypothetical protein [Burkholderiales bacterium]
MTTTTRQIAAFAFSVLMTFGTVAAMDHAASSQYSAAERMAQVAADATQVAALQRVVVVAHRAA